MSQSDSEPSAETFRVAAVCFRSWDMSYRPNSSKGVIYGIIQGLGSKLLKGDYVGLVI